MELPLGALSESCGEGPMSMTIAKLAMPTNERARGLEGIRQGGHVPIGETKIEKKKEQS